MKDHGSTLGAKAYAAIAAVEGLSLPPDSVRRLAVMEAKKLPLSERRAEILRTYRTLAAK